MGVSKESISKLLIGNRFHVKSRILSPYSIEKNEAVYGMHDVTFLVHFKADRRNISKRICG